MHFCCCVYFFFIFIFLFALCLSIIIYSAVESNEMCKRTFVNKVSQLHLRLYEEMSKIKSSSKGVYANNKLLHMYDHFD